MLLFICVLVFLCFLTYAMFKVATYQGTKLIQSLWNEKWGPDSVLWGLYACLWHPFTWTVRQWERLLHKKFGGEE
jgi:protein-S-isoprenylcysteine O-methyltransferase Ste14